MAVGEHNGDPGYDGSSTTGFVSPAADTLEEPIDLAALLDLRRLYRYPVRVLGEASVVVQHGGAALGFRVFDKLQAVEVGAVVENKSLNEVLAHVKARQVALPDSKRRGAAVRARAVNNLEAPGAPSGIGSSATFTLHTP